MDMDTTAPVSKIKMLNYGLIGFLAGFPGAVLAWNWLV
jgi:hypothetical protein